MHIIFIPDYELTYIKIQDAYITYKDKKYKVINGTSKGIYVAEVD